jgi:hypothetical protein
MTMVTVTAGVVTAMAWRVATVQRSLLTRRVRRSGDCDDSRVATGGGSGVRSSGHWTCRC